MKTSYTRRQGKGLTYEIWTDRHGSYEVRLGDNLLRQVHAPSDFFGKSRFGSKAKEAAALVLAKADIEQLRGMDEE